MRRHVGLLAVAAMLVATSAAVYSIHYLLFQDAHHIWIYLVGDIAFVPIEVLLVAIVIERILSRREHRRRLHKMNMVIGTFFSELGVRLLGVMTEGLANRDEVVAALGVAAEWQVADFRRALGRVRALEYRIDADRLDLDGLRLLLAGKRDLLVMLLANPNLLEHETFTDLLWAVFHLSEELDARPSLADLPETDRRHLAGDVQRVYQRLAGQWLRYCRHLKVAYPYIFSVVVRTHPLQENPSPTVT